jgi:hypothetical protein
MGRPSVSATITEDGQANAKLCGELALRQLELEPHPAKGVHTVTMPCNPAAVKWSAPTGSEVFLVDR